MSLHDLYLISPQLAVAGVAILVILLDLVVMKKGLLPFVAFLGLLIPAGLLVVQAIDLNDSPNLVIGTDAQAASIFLGSFSIDRFSLFFHQFVVGFELH